MQPLLQLQRREELVQIVRQLQEFENTFVSFLIEPKMLGQIDVLWEVLRRHSPHEADERLQGLREGIEPEDAQCPNVLESAFLLLEARMGKQGKRKASEPKARESPR